MCADMWLVEFGSGLFDMLLVSAFLSSSVLFLLLTSDFYTILFEMSSCGVAKFKRFQAIDDSNSVY